MTLLELETFLAVVKCGNMAAASQMLHVTQPALSRRIQQLETELGYSLMVREKGKRSVTLTEEGKSFLQIASKWQELLTETDAILSRGTVNAFSVASVYSVTHPLLEDIYPELPVSGCQLRLYNVLSEHIFLNMKQGLFDLAFVEYQEDIEPKCPDIIEQNCFAESFVLVAQEFPDSVRESEEADLSKLDLSQEIYIPWNNAYKFWHANCFGNRTGTDVILEDASLLTVFLKNRRWALVPYMMGMMLKQNGLSVRTHIQNAPPDRIIRCVMRPNKNRYETKLLELVRNKIEQMPSEFVRYLL